MTLPAVVGITTNGWPRHLSRDCRRAASRNSYVTACTFSAVSQRCAFPLDSRRRSMATRGMTALPNKHARSSVSPQTSRRALARLRRVARGSSSELAGRLAGLSPRAARHLRVWHGDSLKESLMARKSRRPKKSDGTSSGINPVTGLPWRSRAPREMRVVSAITTPDARRVPQVRLSGTWLECLGFAPGTRFLVLVDMSNQILLAPINRVRRRAAVN